MQNRKDKLLKLRNSLRTSLKVIKMKLTVMEKDLQNCITYYEHLHMYPELGNEEYETQKYVSSLVNNIGYEIIPVDTTGFIAYLDVGAEQTIALRAELDALPIEESNSSQIRSMNPGVFHACGHDAHMAMLITVSEIIQRNKVLLKNNIALLFEEAEEIGSGTPPICDALTQFNIKSIWGIHVEPDVQAGLIALNEGPIMAGSADINITIRGAGGHSSRPDYCHNPINAVAAIVQSIRTLWVDNIPPDSRTSFAFTKISGGTELNIIPDEVYLGGNLRFFDRSKAELIIDKMKTRISCISREYECAVEFTDTLFESGGITCNDVELCKKVKSKMIDNGLKDTIISIPPLYSSESFSHFCKKYKCIYAFLGNGSDTNYPLHSSNFRVDLNQLPLGIKATLSYIEAENSIDE